MPIEFHFSVPMDCKDLQDSLRINSTTADSQVARLDADSVNCTKITDGRAPSSLYSGGVNTTWIFAAKLVDVSSGVHTVTISNVSTEDGTSFTKVLRYYVHNHPAFRELTYPTPSRLTCDRLFSVSRVSTRPSSIYNVELLTLN